MSEQRQLGASVRGPGAAGRESRACSVCGHGRSLDFIPSVTKGFGE